MEQHEDGWDRVVKIILKWGGIALFVGLAVFTGSQVLDFLKIIMPDSPMVYIGLAVFTVGLIYWWGVLRKEARGAGQFAIAIIMFALSLLLEVTVVALHLGAVGANFLGERTGPVVVILAVLIHLIAKMIYPMVSPGELATMKRRIADGDFKSSTPMISGPVTVSKTPEPSPKALPRSANDDFVAELEEELTLSENGHRPR